MNIITAKQARKISNIIKLALKKKSEFSKIEPPYNHNYIIEQAIRNAAFGGKYQIEIDWIKIDINEEFDSSVKKMIRPWVRAGFSVKWDLFYEGRGVYSKILVLSWK